MEERQYTAKHMAVLADGARNDDTPQELASEAQDF
jgi:hypothetical protein